MYTMSKRIHEGEVVEIDQMFDNVSCTYYWQIIIKTDTYPALNTPFVKVSENDKVAKERV